MPGGEITTQILALRPGRREMGVAMLEGDELVFWGVTGFRKHQAHTLGPAIARRVWHLLEVYEPEVLAMEAPTALRLRMSPLLGVVVRQLEKFAQDAGIRFLAVRPTVVRQRLCGSPQATHVQLTAQLVARYPHLGRYQQNASRLQVEYWKPMFTAVGVGVVGAIPLHYGPQDQG